MARKGFGAVAANKTVGIVLGRQKEELDAARVAGVGQGGLQRLVRSPAARAVAVKTEDHVLGEAKQFMDVLGRAGRAQRGHSVAKSQLCQGYHVHIAFGHQHIALLADGLACLKQAVQLLSLVKYRCFRGVEVFGLFVA